MTTERTEQLKRLATEYVSLVMEAVAADGDDSILTRVDPGALFGWAILEEMRKQTALLDTIDTRLILVEDAVNRAIGR